MLGASAERRTERDGVMVGDGPYAAIGNAFGAYSTLDAAKGLTRAVENESGDVFEYAGYTLGMEHAVMVNEPPHMAEIRAKQAAVRSVVGAAKAFVASVAIVGEFSVPNALYTPLDSLEKAVQALEAS